jgi:hypothetical protein
VRDGSATTANVGRVCIDQLLTGADVSQISSKWALKRRREARVKIHNQAELASNERLFIDWVEPESGARLRMCVSDGR